METSQRICIQRDSAMVMKMIECPRSWSALNHRDGPQTVDFVLEGIADFGFSLWAALYILLVVRKVLVIL